MIVAVIGAGTMGSSIAQVAASSGAKVFLYDTSRDALHRAKSGLEKVLDGLTAKGKMSDEKRQDILSKIEYVDAVNALAEADVVIEAIVEQLEVKKTLFVQLGQIVSETTILASNTSSLSIASIAAACKNPSRVIGIHFFNPAPLMALVEIIPAVQTSEEVLKKSVEMIASWGKLPAVAKDTPGFIVNRVARPYYGEALRIYEEGIADFATIDHAMKSLGGFRMGPFELMDFIGNDINYAVTESVFTAFYFDPRYKPSFTQKRLTEAGYLGRKSGRGYYDYSSTETPQPIENPALHRSIFERILVMLINEAADALHLNIASAADIDTAMTRGVNYPKGLLQWADELGADWCVAKLDELYSEYHEDRYRCSVLLRKKARHQQTFF